MTSFKRILAAIILAISFLPAGGVDAQDNTCFIMAPQENDVWVIIYDADGDGNRGQVLWKGKIEAGKQVSVTSTGGYIRYDYATHPNQPYEGDVDEGCFDHRTIEMF